MKKTRKKIIWKDWSVTCHPFCSKSVVCLHSGFASWWAILVASLPDALLQLVEDPSSPWENQEFHLHFFATSWLQARPFLPHFVYSFIRAFHKLSALFLHQSLHLNQPILCWCNQGYWPLPPPIFLISLPSKYPSRYLRCHLHSVWPWICPVAVFFTWNFTEVSPFRRSVMAFHTFPRSTVLALKIQGSEALTSFARIKSCASVHSMIDLEEGKQNFIENRFCLWIHLSGKFQNFRDKSEEQNSILYKQVLAM